MSQISNVKGSGLQCRTAETGPELKITALFLVYLREAKTTYLLSERGANRKHTARKHTHLVVRMYRTEENTAGTRGIKLNTAHTVQEAITIKQELTH